VKYFILLIFILMACQSPQKVSDASGNKPKSKDANLTMAEAKERAEGLSDISYRVALKLDQAEEFQGSTLVKFKLQKAKPLFVDFKYGQVNLVEVNGEKTDVNYDGFRIYLSPAKLKEGLNEVKIEYSQTYSKNGTGLYRFIDPEDKASYLYTQFEAFDAHQMFPNFDQPDLKATWTLETVVPSNWVVISTTKESVVTQEGQQKKWIFEESPQISTYLFSLHAGPYHMWTSQFEDIPLRLFARKSLAKKVNPREWFEPLKYGLQFYGAYFDYAYPFKKYDSVIAPDFNAGAMENVAAVTFSERYVRSGKKTKAEQMALASVILHEASHMWFGDLVTMKWWNGLWLNESFASYISTYAMSKSRSWQDVWVEFATGDKNWAYTEDEYVTTHPIELKVPDTLNATSNFDGITYGKGASVLKQLHFLVGDKNFRDGLRLYFKTYQYGNTELSDFLGSIGQVAKMDLSNWSRVWLEEQGLDSVKVEYTCVLDKYKTFDLVQTPAPGSNQYRTHRSIIGLFDERNGAIVARKQVLMEYQGARTPVKEMIGEDCAALVYPNLDDHDYVKVELDPKSRESLGQNLGRIQDPLIRAMIWINLNQMLRDQKIKLAEYSKLANDSLKIENNERVIERILESLLGHGKQGYDSVSYYWPQGSEQEKMARNKWLLELESILWSRLQRSKASSDMQKRWFDAYVRAVESQPGVSKLVSLLKEQLKINGLSIDQDRRWDILFKISQMGHPQASALVAAEESLDRSDKGQKQALSARAALPKQEEKIRLYKEVLADKSMSLAKVKSILQGLNPHTENNFKNFLKTDFYEHLPRVLEEHEQEFTSEFVDFLIPRTCDRGPTEKLGRFVKEKANQMIPLVARPLKVALQEENRCLRIREFSKSDLSIKAK